MFPVVGEGRRLSHSLFLQLPVGFRSIPELNWQWSLFIQIEAPQNSGFSFPIPVAALRASHLSGCVGGAQPVTVPAHPSDPASWISHDERIVRNVLVTTEPAPTKA